MRHIRILRIWRLAAELDVNHMPVSELPQPIGHGAAHAASSGVDEQRGDLAPVKGPPENLRGHW